MQRPVLTSSKIRTMPWRCGDLADRLEVARLGEHDPEVHHRRLHDHAGGLAALGDRAARCGAPSRPASLNGTGDRHVDDGLRDAGAVRAATRGCSRSPILSYSTPMRDHHRVVVAVVGAEDLHRSCRGRCGRARCGSRPSSTPSRSSCSATSAGPSAGRAPRRRRSRPRSARRSACRARSAPGRPCRSPGARGPGPSSRSRCGSRSTRCRRRPRPSGPSPRSR